METQNNFVTGSQVRRHGHNYKQHGTDVDNSFYYSSSRGKHRSGHRGESPDRSRYNASQEEGTEDRRSRYNNVHHKSRATVPSSESPRHSSPRHHNNDSMTQDTDNTRHSTVKNHVATKTHKAVEHASSRGYDRRMAKSDHESITSESHSERSYERHANISDHQHEKRNSSQRDTKNMHSQSCNATERSTSRENRHQENKLRNGTTSSTVDDPIRVGNQDLYDRSSALSYVQSQDDGVYSNGHRDSQQSRKECTSNDKARKTNNGQTRGLMYLHERTKQTFPSESELANDNRDKHGTVEHCRNHRYRNNVDMRENCRDNRIERQVRHRSSSVTKNDEKRYDILGETAHSRSHSRSQSISRQSLSKEAISSHYRKTDARNNTDNHTSKSRHDNEQKYDYATLDSPRSLAMATYDDDTQEKAIRHYKKAAMMSTSVSSKESINSPQNETRNQHSKISRQNSSHNRQNLPPEQTSAHKNTSRSSRKEYHTSKLYETQDSNRQNSFHNRHTGRTGDCLSHESVAHSSSSPSRHRVSASRNSERDDVFNSRHSSSCRSGNDTRPVPSSSAPKQNDSCSRFSSDAPSYCYTEEECLNSGTDDSVHRRRSRMQTNNTNSLDVHESPTYKEHSVSSSARGDFSFEDPAAENKPLVRGNRNYVERNIKEKSHDSRGNNMTPFITGSSDRITEGSPGNDKKLLEIDKNESPLASSSNNKSPLNKAQENLPPKTPGINTATPTSSASTLKSSGLAQKTPVSHSVASLLGRGNKNQQTLSSKPGKASTTASITERWRILKQGIIPDKDPLISDTLTGKETAAAIFHAAAVKIKNSLSSVHYTLSRHMPSSTAPGNYSSNLSFSQIPPNESYASLARTDDSGPQKEKSEPGTVSPAKPSIEHIKNEELLPIVQNNAPPDGSPGGKSERPSTVSTNKALPAHCKKTNVYEKLKENVDSPVSEESGQITPPRTLAGEMKRRSKEVDTELTSFLPAEMSRREEKFHDAARINDAASIRQLLKERVNVNCRNNLDRTALHWAAANGNFDVAEVLIENGADLEAKDKYGMRAVLWAAWFGHISVLKALVNAGANTRVTNKQGLGMLHCAAENNHAGVISFVFEALEPHDVNLGDKNERTPLYSAAEGGHVEAVNRLLEAKAHVHKKDKAGMTAVHVAAKCGHIEVLKALLLQGVEVDDRDIEGKTALHLAAEAGHKETVNLLLDYTANPNAETIKEVTPLHISAQEGHVNVCRSLVKYGSNVNAQNYQGNSPLHIAASGNHKEIARILTDAKCEVDLPNCRLQTPLHVAIENGHLEVVQVLLAGGASLDTRDKSGKSALQLAARGNYVTMVDMLIKADRYYANTREYHDKDVGYMDPDIYLRNPQHSHAAQLKDVFWKLAMKQLKPADWKKLAYHWHFTPEHVRAIEQEYTGTTSYKDHGHRLLNIWLHGVRKDENVLKLLSEALVAIDRKQLAERVKKKVNLQVEKPCSPSLCSLS